MGKLAYHPSDAALEKGKDVFEFRVMGVECQ